MANQNMDSGKGMLKDVYDSKGSALSEALKKKREKMADNREEQSNPKGKADEDEE